MSRMIATAVLTVLLAACGQTGPLYMPKDDPNATAVPQPPAPESQTDEATKDETTTDEATSDETVAPSEAAPVDNGTP